MHRKMTRLITLSVVIILLIASLLVQRNWHLEASENTGGSTETVWAWYQATSRAPTWDPLVGKITLNGPFAVGTTGTNTAPNGLNFPMIFTEVTPAKSYTEVTTLFGAKMSFVHKLVAQENGCTITHQVFCTGLLSSWYGLFLKKEYRAKFPVALANLAALAGRGRPVQDE